jgi:RNA polymerase sigma-70 factor (ECF subfamily)
MLLQECPVDVGKKATLGKWYDAYGPKLLAMLESRLDRRAAARRGAGDVLHDAFVRAEQRWDDFARSGLTPYAWLYRLALDCVCDDHDYQHRQRRNVRRDRVLPDASSAQMVQGLFGTGTSPSQAAARDERLERLKGRLAEVLGSLSPDDHEVFCMREVDDLSFAEIAGVLGLKETAARQRYTRARLRLMERWLERYGEEDLRA